MNSGSDRIHAVKAHADRYASVPTVRTLSEMVVSIRRVKKHGGLPGIGAAEIASRSARLCNGYASVRSDLKRPDSFSLLYKLITPPTGAVML